MPSLETLQTDIDTVAKLAASDKTWKERGLSVLMSVKARSRSRVAFRAANSNTGIVVPPANFTLLETALVSAIAVVDDDRHALYLAIAGHSFVAV